MSHRHSLTTVHAKRSTIDPRATYFEADANLSAWVGLGIEEAHIDHMGFEDSAVTTRIQAKDRAHVAVHLTVEQARVLHESLGEALALADSARKPVAA